MGAQANERSRRREGNVYRLSHALILICYNTPQPKLWTELEAGIECLTQLLLILEVMSFSKSSSDPLLAEAAETLQHQLIYNGEVLDIAFESLRNYKEGTQSLGYLEKSVGLGYALFRMMERWAKGKGAGDGMYVRRKKAGKKKVSKGGYCSFGQVSTENALLSDRQRGGRDIGRGRRRAGRRG
jgi:hypothetical protein